MSKITIYDSEFITVEYWEHKKSIYHTIHQPISAQLEIFKEALNAGTDALQKYQIHKWLSDDRKNDKLSQEGNEWSFSDWQPRTMKARWKYWAMIVPEDLAAAGTLTPVIDILFGLGLRMNVFTNMDKALAWLDKVENSPT